MNPKEDTTQLNSSVAQLNTALAGLNKARGTSFKSITPVNTTIQADKLGTTSNFNINPTTPSTGVDSMLGEFETGTQDFQDEFTRKQAEQAKTAGTAKNSSLQSYIQKLTGSKGQAELENEAMKSVDPIEAELNDINDQIRKEQVGLQRRIEALEKNPQGLFGGALGDEINRVKTESVRKQADLSLIQMGVQGKYDSAVAQANRTVDILLEKETKALDASRLVYEDNKDLFTQAEQRQYETMSDDRQRSLNMKGDEMKAVKELSLLAQREGAPTALVQQALATDTQAEAMALIGGYIGLQDRQMKNLQMSNLRLDNAKLSQEINDANSNTVSNGGLIPDKVLTKSTEGEKKGYGFLNRAVNAQSVIDSLESGKDVGGKGYKKSGILTNLYNKIAGTNVIGLLPGSAEFRPGKAVGLQTQNYESYNQASEDFIYAVLRLESGATIPPDEMAGYKRTYFPVTGESSATVKQKQVSREKAIGFLKSTAGNLAPYAEQNQFQEYANLLKSASPAQLKEVGITK